MQKGVVLLVCIGCDDEEYRYEKEKITNEFGHSEGEGLYRADFEHSSCGIGFVANLKGRKSHSIITDALGMLACMEHRVEPDLT